MKLRSSARRWRYGLWSLVGVIALLILANGCASPIPNRDPSGEPFPTVVGETLEKVRTELPTDLSGKPAILLIGYLQETQFDIDRWFLGLLQAEPSAPLYEIPTIPGLLPTLASGWIDNGMRSGIPREDWGAVITLYGSAAEPVAALTGTESGRKARVIVLDRDGRVAWFDDDGYSASKVLAVKALVEELSASAN